MHTTIKEQSPLEAKQIRDPNSVLQLSDLNFPPASQGMANDDCCAKQLIDDNDEFNIAGLDNFNRTINLASCGLLYVIVILHYPSEPKPMRCTDLLFGTKP